MVTPQGNLSAERALEQAKRASEEAAALGGPFGRAMKQAAVLGGP